MDKKKIWHSSIDEEPAANCCILIYFGDTEEVATAYYDKTSGNLYSEANHHSSWGEAKKDAAMWAYIKDVLPFGKLLEKQKSIPEEIQKVIDDYFWEML